MSEKNVSPFRMDIDGKVIIVDGPLEGVTFIDFYRWLIDQWSDCNQPIKTISEGGGDD